MSALRKMPGFGKMSGYAEKRLKIVLLLMIVVLEFRRFRT